MFVVGEAPGAEEDIKGLPFIGQSGQLLREALSNVGFEVDNIYITNLVMCRPPENRQPTQEEINSCSPWLEYKIDVLKPRMIIAAGRYSVAYFMGAKPEEVKITKLSGTSFEGRHKIKVFPLVHPSYVLRGGLTRQAYTMQAAPAACYAKELDLKGLNDNS